MQYSRDFYRLAELPLDLVLYIFGFLRITELLAIEHTSKGIRVFINKALELPREKAFCSYEYESYWLEFALKRCPRVKSIWWYRYEDILPEYIYVVNLSKQEYTFYISNESTITMTRKFKNLPCSKFLTSIRVDSLSILDLVPDRRAVLPQLETLTVCNRTAVLHILKTKWFLTPDWADVDVRFDHPPSDIHTYVDAFTGGMDTLTEYFPVYILPTATMCLNFMQEFIHADVASESDEESVYESGGDDDGDIARDEDGDESQYEDFFRDIVAHIGKILSVIPRDLRKLELSLVYDEVGNYFPADVSRSFLKEAARATAVPRVLHAIEEILVKDFPRVKLTEKVEKWKSTGTFTLQEE